MESRFIVDRNLVTRANIAKSNEEDMAIDDLHVTVGFAGMIDVVRAISALATVQAPTVIDRADT